MATTRPDLNGLLYRLFPGSPPVFLILDGLKCGIPNPATAINLFGANFEQLINSNPDLDEISDGQAISNGAIIARGDGATVYLVASGGTENNVKRPIPNPTVLGQYSFTGQIQNVQQILLDFISTGALLPGR